jgi:hypothetical protein
MSSADEFSRPNQERGSLAVSVVVGVAVSLVFSFIPFSTVLGGVAAGWLRRGDQSDGAIAGALAGLVTFAPFLLLLYLVLGFIAFVGAPSLFSTIAVVLVTGVGLYTVGGGALGGVIGTALSEEV